MRYQFSISKTLLIFNILYHSNLQKERLNNLNMSTVYSIYNSPSNVVYELGYQIRCLKKPLTFSVYH